MNPRRSNRRLMYMVIVIGMVGVVILSNVLFTMVTQKHFRTGVNIKDYKDPDITSQNVLKAKRGTIYDRNGDVIAQDEDTYKIIAYMDESRKGIGDTPAYVQDIKATAKALAPILDMEESDIEERLQSAKDNDLYQTELGDKG